MLMELHKQQDGTVMLVSEAPDTHVWSSGFVDAAVKDGWLEFSGDPVGYEVTPDPNGSLAHASALQLTLPGDRLTMHVTVDGEPTEIVYRITHYPVPQFFRLADDSESDGVRIAPEYGLELVS